MRHTLALLTLFPVIAFGVEPRLTLPLFFFPSTSGFGLEAPDLRASFRTDSVMFRIHDQNLRMHYGSANPGATIEGEQILSGRANFFIGNEVENWNRDVPMYRKIRYRGLYAAIDLT